MNACSARRIKILSQRIFQSESCYPKQQPELVLSHHTPLLKLGNTPPPPYTQFFQPLYLNNFLLVHLYLKLLFFFPTLLERSIFFVLFLILFRGKKMLILLFLKFRLRLIRSHYSIQSDLQNKYFLSPFLVLFDSFFLQSLLRKCQHF